MSSKNRFFVKAGRTDLTKGDDGRGQGSPRNHITSHSTAIASSGSHRRHREGAVFLGDDRRRIRGNNVRAKSGGGSSGTTATTKYSGDDADDDDDVTTLPLKGRADPFAAVDKTYAQLKSVLYHTYYSNAKVAKARKVKDVNRSLLMLPEEHAEEQAGQIFVNGELCRDDKAAAAVDDSGDQKAGGVDDGGSDDEEAFRLELFEDLLERTGGGVSTAAAALLGGAPLSIGLDSNYTLNKKVIGRTGSHHSNHSNYSHQHHQSTDSSPTHSPVLESLNVSFGGDGGGRISSPSPPQLRGRGSKRPNLAAHQELVSILLRHRQETKARVDRQVTDVHSIEYRTITSMLSPVLRLLEDLYKRAIGMHTEQTHSRRAEKVKKEIFSLCEQLGLDPHPYIVTEGVTDTLDFKATADYLMTQKDQLLKIVLDREAQVNNKIAEINRMRATLNEAPIPLVNSLAAAAAAAEAEATTAAAAAAAMADGGGAGDGKAGPLSGTTTTVAVSPTSSGFNGGGLSPSRGKRGGVAADGAASPASFGGSSSRGNFGHSQSGGGLYSSGSFSGLDLPLGASMTKQNPASIGIGRSADGTEEGAATTTPPDLSTGAINYYNQLLADVQHKKEHRVEITRQLAVDIIGLWREHGQMPSLNDPDTPPIDKKILLLLKNNLVNVEGIVGVNQDSMLQLAERKKELIVAREDRIRTTMEMSRRLKLIEDRHFLIDLMKQFEAQARNPLRLFGSSIRLIREERFRNSAYPRLLLIEAVIRPSLLLYQERHGRPFVYQGFDYLTLLDTELKTRSIPRDVFPSLKIRATATLNAKNVENAYSEEVKRKEQIERDAHEKVMKDRKTSMMPTAGNTGGGRGGKVAPPLRSLASSGGGGEGNDVFSSSVTNAVTSTAPTTTTSVVGATVSATPGLDARPAFTTENKTALEILFGGDLHDDCMNGLEASIAQVISLQVPDFAAVVQLSTSVKDVVAERIINMSASRTAQEAAGGYISDGPPESGRRPGSGGFQVASGAGDGQPDFSKSRRMDPRLFKPNDVSNEEWVTRDSKSDKAKELEEQTARLQELGWRLPADFGASKEQVDDMLQRHKKAANKRTASSSLHPTAQDRRNAAQLAKETETKGRRGEGHYPIDKEDEDYRALLLTSRDTGEYPGAARPGSPPRISQLAQPKGYNARRHFQRAGSAKRHIQPPPSLPEEPEPPRVSILKDPCTARHNRGGTCDSSIRAGTGIGSEENLLYMSREKHKQAQLVREINTKYGIHDRRSLTEKSQAERQQHEDTKALILQRHRRLGSLPTGVFSNPEKPQVVPKKALVPAGTARLLKEGSTPRKPGGMTINATQLKNITSASHNVRADETDAAKQLAKEREYASRSHHNENKRRY